VGMPWGQGALGAMHPVRAVCHSLRGTGIRPDRARGKARTRPTLVVVGWIGKRNEVYTVCLQNVGKF